MDHSPSAPAGTTLEARLQRLEDREAIGQVIARYGPAVDSASAADVATLWAEDGTYTFGTDDEPVTLHGRTGLSEMVFSAGHQEIIRGGSGHVQAAPFIEIDGDLAEATGYSMLVRHDRPTGRFYIDRLAANRWSLRRNDDGWQVVDRVNRLLDGQPGARELLANTTPA